MQNEILQWLKDGADLSSGARLYLNYSNNTAFKRLISSDIEAVKLQLFDALVRLGGVDDMRLVESQRRYFVRTKFRQQWTFLDNPQCPNELKILAADKITAWRNYVRAHSRLCSCTTLEQCYQTALEVVDNFIENDSIKLEFDFYTQHNHVLGKHRIFATQKRIEELKKLGPIGLATRKKQLEHTIWRIKSNIAKNTRPDLLNQRQNDLSIKESELFEIEKLISIYV